MKRGKAVKPVKMWAICECSKMEKRIDGTMELFRSSQQAKSIVRDITDAGFDANGVTIIRVLVSPLPPRKRAKKVKP